jgi:Tat protein secretion system quality control protein TatD with DNase activity
MPRVRRRFKTIDAPLNRIQTLILSRRYYHYACELLQRTLRSKAAATRRGHLHRFTSSYEQFRTVLNLDEVYVRRAVPLRR